ncbi:transcriptional regulator, TetR family [Sphingomonas laterariae]|uniref:Transcriptional regulator, TetR family n=1 Tax=Edaphosphingomonas laterariae TaxID=861865 RepID=A0A239G5T6_9SPHN|nr:TetR family transcriptional regulator [Sphingomonas laterariae]SNS63803.1 transcriptional regulator, TetR family [Sphingomonas laterariae]
MANDAAHKIADAAARHCLDAGLGSVTMRSVAAAAGVAPSAVAYHFKTRDRLLVAILDRLSFGIQAWRDGARDQLATAAAQSLGHGAMAAVALSGFIHMQGLASVTAREVARALRTTESADAAAGIVAQIHQQGRLFWQSLPVFAGDDAETRAIWAGVIEGLVPLAMLDRNPITRHGRIIQILMRLEDRLAGRAPRPFDDAPLPPAQDRPSRPTGKQEIVEATIRLSGRVGIEGLTHRNIAAEAGLSVASTTYFYPAKEDIIADAAHELQTRAINAIVSGDSPLPQFMSRIALDLEGGERAELAALTAFSTAAVRHGELRELADTFLKLRGIDALRWLDARGCSGVDRLDGIIWSAASTALVDQALQRPQDQRVAFLDAISSTWMHRLFG